MPQVFPSFDAWLAQAPGLQCRDLGHVWTDYGDKRTHYRKGRRTGRITIEMECLRDDCGVIRTRHLGAGGELDDHNPNSYDYPEGYLFRTAEKTAGQHVRREHKAAIRAALVSGVPASRFEIDMEDD